MKGRRTDKKGFVVPTPGEVKKDREQFMMSQFIDTVDQIFELQFNQLNMNLLSARVDFRKKQIESKKIEEKFEGTQKPLEILAAEHDLDVYGYNRLTGQIRTNIDNLRNKGLSEDEILSIRNGKFNINDWSNKNKPVDVKDTSYMG